MFDTALLESRKDPRGHGKGVGLPVAIALHVAVIGAFVGASVWSVGEPPEPVIPVTFFAPLPAPPPPRGDGGHLRETAPTRRDPQSTSPTIVLPTNPEPPDTPLQREGPDYPGDDRGPTPGELDGVENGTGGTPAVEPGSGRDADRHIVGGDVKAPILTFRTEPDYPESLRRAHVEGLVILEAVITADGAVEELRVLRSANPLLDRAVLDAVRQWRYKPATLNGRAVSVYLTVTVTFGLKS